MLPIIPLLRNNEGNVLAEFNSLSRGEHKVVVVNPDNGEMKTYRIVILMGFGGGYNGTDNQNQETQDTNLDKSKAANSNSVNGNTIGVNSLNSDLFYDNPLYNDNGISNDDSNTTNQSANTSVSKAIETPQANGENNNLWWIILAIIVIVAAGGIIKKYKG